ncbi:MAG: hypothetical protein QW165_02250 [Candidatus Woesearchaeota archaeon]
MNHHLLLFLCIGIVIFFALMHVEMLSLTGAAIVKDYTGKESYAMNMHATVLKFLQVEGITYPHHVCTEIAKELYLNIAQPSAVVTAGFASSGPERVASINFVTEWDDVYGTIDIIHGKEILSDYDADTMMSISVESIVRLPKRARANFFSLDLFGFSRDRFYITEGKFSTPSFDCYFGRENGELMCDCDAHPIAGIEIAGITGVRAPLDIRAKLQEELEISKLQRQKG